METKLAAAGELFNKEDPNMKTLKGVAMQLANRYLQDMKKMQQKSKKDKKASSLSNSFSQGYLHIYSTYSNILLTLTNIQFKTASLWGCFYIFKYVFIFNNY